MHSIMSSFESLYSWLCSSTAATSRKQVTNRLYVAVFILIHIPQLSRHLNESLYTWNILRVNVHDICFVTFCTELCSFFKIVKSIYMYIHCDSIITQSGSTGKEHVITDRVIYMRSLFKIFNATSFTGFHIRKKMSHPVSFGMEHQSVYLVLWL